MRNLSRDFPPKPQWMRWATYERLQAGSERFRCDSLLAAVRRLGLLKDELDGMGMG